MCRAGGPRCSKHAIARLARCRAKLAATKEKLKQALRSGRPGKIAKAQRDLEKAENNLDAAENEYFLCTDNENKAREEADRLRELAEQTDNKREKARLLKKAEERDAYADFVREKRLKKRREVIESQIEYDTPSGPMKVSRQTVERIAVTIHALENGDAEVVPGYTGQLHDIDKTKLVKFGTNMEEWKKSLENPDLSARDKNYLSAVVYAYPRYMDGAFSENDKSATIENMKINNMVDSNGTKVGTVEFGKDNYNNRIPVPKGKDVPKEMKGHTLSRVEGTHVYARNMVYDHSSQVEFNVSMGIVKDGTTGLYHVTCKQSNRINSSNSINVAQSRVRKAGDQSKGNTHSRKGQEVGDTTISAGVANKKDARKMLRQMSKGYTDTAISAALDAPQKYHSAQHSSSSLPDSINERVRHNDNDHAMFQKTGE